MQGRSADLGAQIRGAPRPRRAGKVLMNTLTIPSGFGLDTPAPRRVAADSPYASTAQTRLCCSLARNTGVSAWTLPT